MGRMNRELLEVKQKTRPSRGLKGLGVKNREVFMEEALEWDKP